ELAGEQLPVFVVHRLLEQRLPERMRDAALHLPLDEERVDLRPAVVDGDVLRDRYLTRVAVDVHGADVRAERKREVLWFEKARRLEPRLDAGREALGHVGGAGELRPRNHARRD